LTLPDELIDAARIDGASEWRIYLFSATPILGFKLRFFEPFLRFCARISAKNCR